MTHPAVAYLFFVTRLESAKFTALGAGNYTRNASAGCNCPPIRADRANLGCYGAGRSLPEPLYSHTLLPGLFDAIRAMPDSVGGQPDQGHADRDRALF